MITHHPEKSLLIDYSAGNISFGPAMCVTAHLERCLHCQRELQGITALGAVLMEQLCGADVNPDLLARVMQRIDSEDSAATQTVPLKEQSVLDKFVPKNLNSIDWHGMDCILKSHEIDVGDPSHYVTLIHMRRGGTVPRHTHKGQEITVVLQGSFSDAHGSYQIGDFVECTPEIEHQPVANQNEDCICLASRSAPIRFTGPLMRTLNPFMRR